MKAKFLVPFEDHDYEGWAAACGLKPGAFEPRSNGAFAFHVDGPAAAIEQFAAELGWDPE
jgi:hypothetical protein